MRVNRCFDLEKCVMRHAVNVLCVFSGRYEEDFLQERMKFLQMWVDRMVKHPVVSRSDVFLHFLTCTDEKVRGTVDGI